MLTQEEKQLLLKDLSARLPYGVQTLADSDKEFDGGIIGRLVGIVPYTSKKYDFQEHSFYQEGCLTPFTIEEIRPYLRSMSSMTEEECKELGELSATIENVGESLPNVPYYIEVARPEQIDWLNARHFDYRGLIEKGLAIEVTEENNPYKTELL